MLSYSILSLLGNFHAVFKITERHRPYEGLHKVENNPSQTTTNTDIPASPREGELFNLKPPTHPITPRDSLQPTSAHHNILPQKSLLPPQCSFAAPPARHAA